MLTCAICKRALRECCDLFYEAVTEDGEEVVVCGDCALANGLMFEEEQLKDKG